MSLSDRLVHWNELMMNNAARIEKRKDQSFCFFALDPTCRAFFFGVVNQNSATGSLSFRFGIIPARKRVRLWCEVLQKNLAVILSLGIFAG
jgi:hypothetical protein